MGLALGSGGPRGLAHIGVIRALLQANPKPDCITGTSVGSMIGGLYATLQDIDLIEDIFLNITVRELTTMFSDFTRGSGILKGNQLEKFLEKYLDGISIKNLKTPFAAVATDIQTAEEVILNHGNLVIMPDVNNFSWSNLPDKKLRKEIIDRGYIAATENLSQSSNLLI